jgi:hypothetical protein
MSSESLSFTVRYWHDPQTSAGHVQIARIDHGREADLAEGTFLLRVTINAYGLVERCYVRHLASGREAYVQGGAGLSAFVEQCLFKETATNEGASDKTGG